MIITKVLGLTNALTSNKKAKITILSIEIAVLAYALYNQNKENKKRKLNS